MEISLVSVAAPPPGLTLPLSPLLSVALSISLTLNAAAVVTPDSLTSTENPIDNGL